MSLLYIKFMYQAKNNQQGCFSLCKRFSLWHLGPWMNHWPPVWWSTFRFMFLKWQLVCTFGITERDFTFHFFWRLVMFLYIIHVFSVISPLIFYSEITCYIKYLVFPYSVDVVSTLPYITLYIHIINYPPPFPTRPPPPHTHTHSLTS